MKRNNKQKKIKEGWYINTCYYKNVFRDDLSKQQKVDEIISNHSGVVSHSYILTTRTEKNVQKRRICGDIKIIWRDELWIDYVGVSELIKENKENSGSSSGWDTDHIKKYNRNSRLQQQFEAQMKLIWSLKGHLTDRVSEEKEKKS